MASPFSGGVVRTVDVLGILAQALPSMGNAFPGNVCLAEPAHVAPNCTCRSCQAVHSWPAGLLGLRRNSGLHQDRMLLEPHNEMPVSTTKLRLILLLHFIVGSHFLPVEQGRPRVLVCQDFCIELRKQLCEFCPNSDLGDQCLCVFYCRHFGGHLVDLCTTF